MAVTETIKIEGDAKGLEETIKKLNGNVENLIASLEEVSSVAKNSFGSIDGGFKKASSSIKSATDKSIDGLNKISKESNISASSVSGSFAEASKSIDQNAAKSIDNLESVSKKSKDTSSSIANSFATAGDSIVNTSSDVVTGLDGVSKKVSEINASAEQDFTKLSNSVKKSSKKSASGLNEINQEISGIKSNAANAFGSVSTSANDSSEAVNELTDSVDKLDGSVDNVQAKSKKGFDSMAKGVKNVEKQAGKTGGSISKLANAIKSLTVVAVVGDVIMEVFTGNQKVVDLFNVAINTIKVLFSDLVEVVFPAIEEALDALFTDPVQTIKDFGKIVTEYGLNLFKQLGNSIGALGKSVLAFFKGDFAEASKQAKEAFSEVVDGIVGVEEGGIKKVQKAAERLTKRVKEAVKEGEKLNNLEKEAAKADVERQKIQLQAQTLAEKQRQARDDEFASIEDRIKANGELGKILEQQYKDESAQIEKKVAFARAQHNLNATTENYVALQQALLEETDLLERLEGQRSEQKMNYISLLREQRDIDRSNTDAYLEQLEKQLNADAELLNSERDLLMAKLQNIDILKKASLESIDEELANTKEGTERYAELIEQRAEIERNAAIDTAKIKKDLNKVELPNSERERLMVQLRNIDILKTARLAAIEDELNATKEGTARYAELINERQAIEQDAAIETAKIKKDLNQKDIEDRKMVNDAYMNLAQQSLSALASLSELFAGDNEARQRKAFQLNKALQIADATMATYTAVVGALGAKGADGLLPFPVRVANAVAAGVIGAANVAKIAATKFDGAEGPTPDTSYSPTSAGASTTPQFNVVGRGGVNQLAESVNGMNARPVRAYVVAGEVTSQQNLNRRRARTATFG
jgi:chromosome segregation ATPase